MTDVHVPETEPAVEGDPPVHLEESHGMTDKNYVKLAFILAFVTGAEVIWSYLPTWDNAHGFKSFVEVAGLLIMMGIKFFCIAAFFMHLRFDNKILTRVFYAGLFLATFVYCVALSTFHFWSA